MKQYDVFDSIVFLYFVTLHADNLSFDVGGYTVRLNNIVAIFLVGMLLVRKNKELIVFDKKFVLMILALFSSVFISFLLSDYKTRCFFYMGWVAFTLLSYVVLPYLMIKTQNAEKIFSLYLVSFFVVGILATLQLLLSIVGISDPINNCQIISGTISRPQAFTREPCYYVTYMTPFVCLYNFYFLAGSKQAFFIFSRPSLMHALIVNILYLMSTSAAVFFAYSAFFVVIFFFSKVEKKKIFKALLGFCFFGILLGMMFPHMFKHYFLRFFFHGFSSHWSIYERWWGIIDSWQVFIQNPLFGVGLGGLPKYLMNAFLSGDIRFSFLYFRDEVVLDVFDSTNVVTELLASLGMVGLVAVLLLFVYMVNLAKRACQNDRFLAYNLLFSTLIMVFVLCFYGGLLRTYIFTHIGLVIAFLEKIAHGSKSCETTSPEKEKKAVVSAAR